MERIEALTRIVIDEAIAIHRELGPGLFESVYESILAGRLERRGLQVARQVILPVTFDGQTFDAAFKIDILVENCLVLELKAVDLGSRSHPRQLLTYLRLMKQPLGLVLNFAGETMKEGIRRVVNQHRSQKDS